MNMKITNRIQPIEIIALTARALAEKINLTTKATNATKANINKSCSNIFIPPRIYLVAPQIIITMRTTAKIQPNAIAALTKNAIVETNNTTATITNIMKANSNKRHPHIFIPPKNKEVIDWISSIHLLLLRCIWFTFLTDYYSK